MPKEAVIRKKAIKILTDKNWVCWYAPKVRFKQTDVFGIIDVLALRGNQKKNIQLTTLPNISTRRKKITAFLTSYQISMPVEIWGWDNKKKTFRRETVNIKLKKRRSKNPVKRA